MSAVHNVILVLKGQRSRSWVRYAPKCTFYAQKQLLLSARLRNLNSFCLSVRLSHRWISQKRCKLGSPYLHHRLPGRL